MLEAIGIVLYQSKTTIDLVPIGFAIVGSGKSAAGESDKGEWITYVPLKVTLRKKGKIYFF